MSCGLSPALASAANCAAEAFDLCFAQIDVGHSQQRRHSLLGRISKVGSDNVRKYILTRGLSRLCRIVYVARAILPMLDQLFFSEDAEDRADRRIRRWIREVRHYLGDRCSGAPVEDVHYLALSAGEGRRFLFGGH